MRHALQWTLSLIFIAQMYLAMLVLAIIFTPFAIFSRNAAYLAMHSYCRWVRFSAHHMIGLRSEVRGPVPRDEVLVAAKHQSFFDIILIFGALPRPKFIMKRELIWAPILGQYALRIGCVPVNRGKRGQAITQMMAAVKSGAQLPGQLIIYPQGTRVAPNAYLPYKIGSAALYTQLGQDCVPAATNVGVFWPRHGIYRKPGLAVIEFLPRIKPGLDNASFMAELEGSIETASDALMLEAGFNAKAARTKAKNGN